MLHLLLDDSQEIIKAFMKANLLRYDRQIIRPSIYTSLVKYALNASIILKLLYPFYRDTRTS
jgi:hypothetical protein